MSQLPSFIQRAEDIVRQCEALGDEGGARRARAVLHRLRTSHDVMTATRVRWPKAPPVSGR